MMIKSITLLVILSLFIFSCSLLTAQEKDLCKGENATLSCLKQNFIKLYSNDYEQFWNILHNAANKMQEHEKLSDVSTFMDLAVVIQGNAEVSEFFSEISEKFCVSNPTICLDALVSLDEKSRKAFMHMLRHPIYLSKMEIDHIFLKYRELKKYREIIQIYFEIE